MALAVRYVHTHGRFLLTVPFLMWFIISIRNGGVITPWSRRHTSNVHQGSMRSGGHVGEASRDSRATGIQVWNDAPERTQLGA